MHALLSKLALGLLAPLLLQEPYPQEARDATLRARPPEREPTEFVRMTWDDGGEPAALQTATVRYRSTQGDLVVDLIAVVHIGDARYYQALNRGFVEYDALLYEMVAEPGREVPGREPRESGSFATLLLDVGFAYLGLTSQVQRIDYTRANFVHADLSPSEMAAAWEKRGENGLTLALGVFADVLRQANRDALEESPAGHERLERDLARLDPLELFLDPHGGDKLKRLLALDLARQMKSGAVGSTLDGILVRDRNEAAMKVLVRQIADGKKHLALFYGAAHMPDFERRLVLELGLRRERLQWQDAWDLRTPSGPSPGNPFRLLGDLLDDPGR